MSISAPIYHQLFNLLRQHTTYRDLRHLKALAWMIHALISRIYKSPQKKQKKIIMMPFGSIE